MAAFYRRQRYGFVRTRLTRGLLPIHLSHRRFTGGLKPANRLSLPGGAWLRVATDSRLRVWL